MQAYTDKPRPDKPRRRTALVDRPKPRTLRDLCRVLDALDRDRRVPAWPARAPSCEGGAL